MKKRNIHQSTHPFDDYPYEVFYNNLWHPVERLKVTNGKIYTHLVDGEDIIEEDIPFSNHRIRSRKANLSDCICFLRPGVDVCVLSTSEDTESSSEEDYQEPVWLDAKINSIERKPHEPECVCQFYVTFYVTQGPLAVSKKALHKEIVQVSVDQILIIQKLDRVPCENVYYRWDYTEDCSSLQKFRLFTGKFASDLTWLLISSLMKQVEFEIFSLRNKIVYQIVDDDNDKCLRAVNFKMEMEMSVPVIFPFTLPVAIESEISACTIEDGQSSCYDVMGLRRSKRRYVKPERYLGCDGLTESDIDEARLGFCKTYRTESWEYEEMPLALSIQADHAYFRSDHVPEMSLVEYKISNKSRQVTNALPIAIEGPKSITRRRNGSFVPDDHQSDKSESDKDESKNQKQLAVVPVPDEVNPMVNEEDPFDTDVQDNFSMEFNNLVSSYIYTSSSSGKQSTNASGIDFPDNADKWNWTQKHKKVRKGKRKGFHLYPEKDSFRDLESFRVTGSGRRRTFTASTYRDMIRRCMDNIKSTINIDQTPVLDKWKEFQQSKTLKHDDNNDSYDDSEDDEQPKRREKEHPEVEMLFKEMELCLASTYLLDDQDCNIDSQKKWAFDLRSEVETKSETSYRKVCQHEFKLNEEIGILCQLCGFVSTEIKNVSPSFLNSLNSMASKALQDQEEEHNPNEDSGLDFLSIPAASNIPLSEGEDNVWALIPDLRNKLRSHQKRAYEFLWRNIAGSSIPAEMESSADKRGGCVVSHSPGAGKTLLIIAFLVSYLKLFPGARPLVLAPKTTLYTWYKEIIKWEIPIPVYQIHGGQTYRGEIGRQKFKIKPGAPKPNQDVMHVLDCLEKIQRWLSHPSVLLMGYTSFLTLTRDDSKYAYRQYMGQVLRQCPGVLILDEGHNPRSTKSRLRKALMKVDTGLRILLSGTLFQNNFGEYFNTLTLARPIFVKEVLMELDPAFKRRKKGTKSRFSLENRARKFFIDKISRRFDSHKVEEQMEALNMLKNLTGDFIDVHEGGSSDNLPGLQIYTLMMKSTPYQQELLTKLQNQRPAYKGFPLELELLITLGSIHPWLIRTTACATQYFDDEVLQDLEQYKFDLKFGSKVRFIMSLIPRCIMRNEKVLIFCHNIAPISLFIELFEAFYGWRRGLEVLVLQGDLELFERGRVMDKFEEASGPSRVMLASITACAEGISLTAASRVILLDSEWNPSKSKQAIARAFRPGQAREVYVYQLLAKGTLEEEKHSRTTWKEWLSCMIFSEELVEDPSKWQAEMIEDDILREIVEEDRATLFHMIMKNVKASSSNPVVRGKN